jgi:dienelactone hydrolase
MTPFKDLAEGLAKHGIASVRYDKRSFAHGFKMLMDKSEVITVKQETIEDAVLASKLLKNDSRIDADKVFIIGHSMGGMLAPRIDADCGNFKGLVIMAGSLRTLEEIMLSQTEEMLASMKGIAKKLTEKSMNKIFKKFDGMYEMSDQQAKKLKIGNGTTLYYFKEMGEHPAKKYLAETDKPILVMQGGKDVQAKAEVDFAAYKNLLGDRDNVSFKLYPDLNHCFVPAIYGDINRIKKEYSVEQHIGEDVISDIADWILSVSK